MATTGTQITYSVIIEVATSAAAGLTYRLIHPGTIVDYHFVLTASGGGGSLITVSRQVQGAGAFNAIGTDLSGAGAANSIVRATTITEAQSTCAAGDVLRVLTSGGIPADVRGRLILTILENPSGSAA